MLEFIFAVLAFIVAVLILIGVHEFGHFVAARCCGVKVLRFSIGFGKALYRWYDKQGTEYVVALLPLGGYVKLLDEREAPVASKDRARAFNNRPLYQRFIILIAGVFFNLVFAMLAFWFVYTAGIVFIKPVIGAVTPNSIAAQAGLKAGDELLAIGKRNTNHWAAVSMALVMHYGEQGKLAFTVREPSAKQTRIREMDVDLRQWRLDALHPNPLGSLGIVPYYPKPLPPTLLSKQKFSILTAWRPALEQVRDFVTFNLAVLYKMVVGVISWHSLGGPVSIFQAAVLAAGQGAIVYINFLALLSISLAVVNLLPIPGLDGAQILYLLYEFLRRKPVSVAVQLLLFRLGIIFLVILMLQVMLNDLLRLYK